MRLLYSFFNFVFYLHCNMFRLVSGQHKVRRVAAVIARSKTKQSLSPQVLPAAVTPHSEKDLRAAISIMAMRGHAGAERSDWPEVKKKISADLKVDPRRVHHVLEKISQGKDAGPRSPGAGRKNRIEEASEKFDRVFGGLSWLSRGWRKFLNRGRG